MTGYNRIAQLFGDYPNLTIYRKFSALSSKMLLYMQAELAHLEHDLEVMAEEDPQRATVDVSWAAMFGESNRRGAELQREKVVQIQEKLNAYHATLLQTSRVLNLSKPLASDLAFLRDWLEMPQGGDFFLQGFEADPWEPPYSADLVVLGSGGQKDDLARYLSWKMAQWYHNHVRRYLARPSENSEEKWGGFSEYSDQTFVTIGNLACMVLSSFIPTSSIFALYFIKSIAARLATITVTSLLFSFVMMVIAQGKRVDVFAATTAFAAVQVVFVGGVNVFALS